MPDVVNVVTAPSNLEVMLKISVAVALPEAVGVVVVLRDRSVEAVASDLSVILVACLGDVVVLEQLPEVDSALLCATVAT